MSKTVTVWWLMPHNFHIAITKAVMFNKIEKTFSNPLPVTAHLTATGQILTTNKTIHNKA